jgi:hypothetical protein
MRPYRIPFLLIGLLAISGCSGDDIDSPYTLSTFDVEITIDREVLQVGEPITIVMTNTSLMTIHVYSSCPPALERETPDGWEYHALSDDPCPAIPPRTFPFAPRSTITMTISAETSRDFLVEGTYRKGVSIARTSMGHPERFYSAPIRVSP